MWIGIHSRVTSSDELPGAWRGWVGAPAWNAILMACAVDFQLNSKSDKLCCYVIFLIIILGLMSVVFNMLF